MDDVHRGVEAVFHIGLGWGSRRILADDQSDRAMRIHMVRAVLGVVFQNKDGRVLPVRAVGDRFDDASQRQVVIRNRGRRTRKMRTRAARMVVGQI